MANERQIAHMRKESMRIMEAGQQYGWKVEVTKSEPLKEATPNHEVGYVRVDVTAERNGEHIHIWWGDARLTVAPSYTFGGVETKLRNNAAVLKQMADKPDPSQARRRQRLATRRGGESMELIEIIRDLPWEPDELTDPELLKAVYGKTLVWQNGVSGKAESDVVKLGETYQSGPNWNKINFHVTTGTGGRRIINFVGQFGYRSVAADALLRVG